MDVIVTIDLGMTATAVAYSRQPHKKICQMDWMVEVDKGTYKPTTKIPTVLKYGAYSSPRGGHLISWGFLASESSDTVTEKEHFRIVEWFKPFLNPEYLKAARRTSATFYPKSDSEVRRWYIDYLRKIYDVVQKEILKDEAVRPWDAMQIEFRFTWPTTWTPADIESFRDCIVAAGYQNDQGSHRVDLSLSEAQAAALYAAGQSAANVKDGHKVMVCDVGGGTIDIAVVRAVVNGSDPIRFELDWTCQGTATGATEIDAAFQMLIKQRLSLLQNCHLDIARISRDLRESIDWYNIKLWRGDLQSYYLFPMNLADNEAAGIKSGYLQLNRDELQDVFRETFAGVQRAVLDAIQGYNEPLNHLIGCGGYFHITSARDAFQNILASAAQNLKNCSDTKIDITKNPYGASFVAQSCGTDVFVRELAVSEGGCLYVSRGTLPRESSLGLVCGEHVYNLASTSKLSWISGNSEIRSGTDTCLLEGDTKDHSSLNIRFNRYPPKSGYYYLTFVLLPKLRHDAPQGSDDRADKPVCQIRVRKQHIASKWAFMSAAEPKPFILTWKTSDRQMYLEIHHVESGKRIPFEMCESNTSPSVEVKVPLPTKLVKEAQWK